MSSGFRRIIPSALRGSLFEQWLSDLRLFVSIRTWGALTALRLSSRYLKLIALSLVSRRKIQGSIAARFLHDEWRNLARVSFPSPLFLDSRANDLSSELPDLNFLQSLGIRRLLVGSNFKPNERVSDFISRAKVMGFEVGSSRESRNEILRARKFADVSDISDSLNGLDVDHLFKQSALLIRAGKVFDIESPIEAIGLNPRSPMRLLKGKPTPLIRQAGRDSGAEATSKIAWSVIIPVRDHFEYLPLVLQHLSSQDYPLDSVEVLIIDDGSETAVAQILNEPGQAARWPYAVTVIRLERNTSNTNDDTYRAGVARNAGLAEAKGEKVLFLDSDILIGPNLFSELDTALEQHDLVQCPRQMLTAEASERLPTYQSISLNKDTYAQSGYWETFKNTPDWNQLASPWKFVCTYSLAAKRETLRALGPFRPEFCDYGFEDVELGYRFFRSGASFHLLVGSDVFHLFPKDESHSRHFDIEKRRLALKRSAQLFYRLHMDPAIYIELSTLMK